MWWLIPKSQHWDAEVGIALSSMPAWATKSVPGQSETHSKILPQKGDGKISLLVIYKSLFFFLIKCVWNINNLIDLAYRRLCL